MPELINWENCRSTKSFAFSAAWKPPACPVRFLGCLPTVGKRRRGCVKVLPAKLGKDAARGGADTMLGPFPESLSGWVSSVCLRLELTSQGIPSAVCSVIAQFTLVVNYKKGQLVCLVAFSGVQGAWYRGWYKSPLKTKV